MSKNQLSATVTTKTFGRKNRPTIYYITGYGFKISHFRLHIWILNRNGFRVVAFDHDPSLLDSGDPEQLRAACDMVNEYIEEDRKTANVAGIYGTSLGSFFALYLGSKQKLEKIAISAGLDSFARIVMEQPRLKFIRKTFIKNGYDEKGLYDAWKNYDFVLIPELFKGKKLLVMDSKADNLIKYEAVLDNVANFKDAGAQVKLLSSKRLGHGKVVIRNWFRIRRTARFFRP